MGVVVVGSLAMSAARAQGGPESPGSAGYANGFYIHDNSGNYSLQVDGLLQPRFNHFNTDNTDRLGGTDQTSNNFDLFLGRLYFSGNLVDPSLTYFVTLQGSTTGNGSGVTLLDAEIAKTFSPYLKVEGGRYWSAYTYEYNTDIAQYLFPDLSAAEWAFSLGRQTGFRISGQAGRLTYRLSASNSIPGSDVGNTENLHAKMATILNFQYDVLEPYAAQESSPDPAGARKPQLSLWASAMYNPVEYASVFQNDRPGDVTHGATTSVNFRYGYFTFQGSGYYKKNQALAGVHEGFDSHGWQEQAGYYLVPGRLELAERVDGLRWGLGQIPATGGTETQWYAGPANFSYRNLRESTLGLNYYLHGHGAKMQFQYSHLSGEGFNGEGFSANRVILQAQLAF